MVDVFHIKYVIAPANSGRWVVICCFITTGHVSSVSFINLLLILIGHALESGCSNGQIEICCCLIEIRMFDSVTVYFC